MTAALRSLNHPLPPPVGSGHSRFKGGVGRSHSGPSRSPIPARQKTLAAIFCGMNCGAFEGQESTTQ